MADALADMVAVAVTEADADADTEAEAVDEATLVGEAVVLTVASTVLAGHLVVACEHISTDASI